MLLDLRKERTMDKDELEAKFKEFISIDAIHDVLNQKIKDFQKNL